MTTAYLLAVFRIDGDTLELMRTEISDNEDGTAKPGELAFVVDSAIGPSWLVARMRLMEDVKATPSREWALRSLVQR